MRDGFCCVVSLLVFVALPALAQEPSYDGNRWYDVEVSIFTNEVPGGTRSEFPVAGKLTASYLPRLRELTTRASVLMIDFPEDQPATLLPAVPVAPEVPLITMGPVYSPAVRDAFKLIDVERDSFVDLGNRAAQFNAMNREIEGAPEHRLLWHKVWRQPLAGRAQTSAVFVSGGDMRGEHYELEGSLRVVENGRSAMLDINVWLNEFQAGALVAESVPIAVEEEWTVPALPFAPDENLSATNTQSVPAPDTQAWVLSAVWQLAQTRELEANQLYYLDHPAIGVLIQVRPYLLPPRLPLDGEEDF